LDRVLLGAPPEPPGEPPDVRVDGDAGDVEGVAEDDVRRLAAHPGQTHERVEVGGDLAAVVLEERGRQPAERGRLGPEEPERPQHLLELLLGDGGELGRAGPAAEQLRGHGVDPHVGRLRGEDRGDEQLEGGGEVELAPGVRPLRREEVVDLRRGRRGPLPGRFVGAHRARLRAVRGTRWQDGRQWAWRPAAHTARWDATVADSAISSGPLFAALDDEARAALREAMQEVGLRRGETLFHEGDPGDRLYLVIEGKIKLGHRSSDG